MAVIIGSIVATMAVMMMWAAKAQKEVNERGGCPNCGMPVPRFRNPTSLRQAFWGGWTCSNCGTDMDRNGKQVLESLKIR